MSASSKPCTYYVESHPGKVQPTKARPSQDLVFMRSQWDATDLLKPCCENCIDRSAVLDNLNDDPDEEEEFLPSPKPFIHRRLHAQPLSTKICIGSHQSLFDCQQIKQSEVANPNCNPRSSYNRELGKLGLDSERKLETKNARVDRSAEFDEFLQTL